ncbi:MAG: hypothetical protein IKS52_00685 [Clostridia bacterium]|nr:hypothetical protein [Clostridia bacterium]
MKRKIMAACLAAVLLCAACMMGPRSSRALAEETDAYGAFESAYQRQVMPDGDLLPEMPEAKPAPASPYGSVTEANLQGRWVHRYKEGGVSFEDILTVNGDRALIESFSDGERSTVWNGAGDLNIEDRSYRGVCPAITVCEDTWEGGVVEYCAIYIRWVEEDRFFDGLTLDEWIREAPEDPWDQYLYDTVTLDSLQGIWYSDYMEDGVLYQDVLSIDGDSATLFETADGTPGSIWNGAGTAWIEMVEHMENQFFPELMIRMESGASAGSTAGICVSRVDENRFYDALFKRWFVRIEQDDDWSEGNLLFAIYGGEVEAIDGGYAFAPYGMDDQEKLILDAATVLVHPEMLDGWEEGNDAVQWIANLMARDPETMQASGVYDVDVTGSHIDRVYGLYWWD